MKLSWLLGSLGLLAMAVSTAHATGYDYEAGIGAGTVFVEFFDNNGTGVIPGYDLTLESAELSLDVNGNQVAGTLSLLYSKPVLSPGSFFVTPHLFTALKFVTDLHFLNIAGTDFFDPSTGAFSLEGIVEGAKATFIGENTEDFIGIHQDTFPVSFFGQLPLEIISATAQPDGTVRFPFFFNIPYQLSEGDGRVDFHFLGAAPHEPHPVPEPTTALLTLLGVGAMVTRRRLGRSSSSER